MKTLHTYGYLILREPENIAIHMAIYFLREPENIAIHMAIYFLREPENIAIHMAIYFYENLKTLPYIWLFNFYENLKNCHTLRLASSGKINIHYGYLYRWKTRAHANISKIYTQK